MPSPALSKSKFLAGRQCTKLLWHLRNSPASFAPEDDEPGPLAEQGRQVGLLARELFPGGIEIPWEQTVREKLKLTKQALKERVPVYEAAVSGGGACARKGRPSPPALGHSSPMCASWLVRGGVGAENSIRGGIGEYRGPSRVAGAFGKKERNLPCSGRPRIPVMKAAEHRESDHLTHGRRFDIAGKRRVQAAPRTPG